MSTPEHQAALRAAAEEIQHMRWPSMSQFAHVEDRDKAAFEQLVAILSKHLPAPESAEDTQMLDIYEKMVREGVRPAPRYDEDGGFLGWEWEGHKRPLFPTLRTALAAIRAAMDSQKEGRK